MAGKIDNWIGAVDRLVAKMEAENDERTARIARRSTTALGAPGGRAQTQALADVALANAEDFHANQKTTKRIYQALNAVKYAMEKQNRLIDNIWKN